MNVTYLIGAGASAYGVPVVSEMSKALNNLINYLQNHHHIPTTDTIIIGNGEEINLHDEKANLLADLQWLTVQENKHATIDTFAKKLFITKKHKDLERLKRTFSLFISAYQLQYPADPRYDLFFAAILDTDKKLPPEINFISWNYDYQLELSLEEYLENGDLESTSSQINVQIKNMAPTSMNSDASNFIKLNGSAGFFSPSKKRTHRYLHYPNNQTLDNRLTEIIKIQANAKYNPEIESSLSFAWENEQNGNTILDKARKIIRDTQVLVIIGYSFPYFNREIDKFILSNGQNLSKIYIQDPVPGDVEERLKQSLFEREKTVLRNSIEYKTRMQEFFIPPEL